MQANDRQVGGDHYKTSIEPWDYILSNGIDFMEGNIIKYVSRARSKNGANDYQKALHYTEKLIEHRETRMVAGGTIGGINLKDFALANELTQAEENIVLIMSRNADVSDLRIAKLILEQIIEYGPGIKVQCQINSLTGELTLIEQPTHVDGGPIDAEPETVIIPTVLVPETEDEVHIETSPIQEVAEQSAKETREERRARRRAERKAKSGETQD